MFPAGLPLGVVPEGFMPVGEGEVGEGVKEFCLGFLLWRILLGMGFQTR